tara:strand:+ start:1458 stop:1700 length:243 start_codon:yes stop_codon:yes gene_type:complete
MGRVINGALLLGRFEVLTILASESELVGIYLFFELGRHFNKQAASPFYLLGFNKDFSHVQETSHQEIWFMADQSQRASAF